MPLLGPLDLRPLNTLGLAAQAHQAWRLDALTELDALHAFLAAQAQPPLLLGGGSNLLLARDLDEPLVLVRTRGRRILSDRTEQTLVEIAAGESWDGTVRWAIAHGLAGIENLILIPGTTGAAPWQNIGAYGVELASVVHSVDAWHCRQNRIETFAAADCAFGYRDSRFKQADNADWLITTVRLALVRGGPAGSDYGEVRAELAAQAAQAKTGAATQALGSASGTPPAVTAADFARAIERIRRRKLPDPAKLGNAGSFFKNPVLGASVARQLNLQAEAEGLGTLPLYPFGSGFKTSAAWLIERCGWKGHRDGDAGVSPDHALVLVNYGSASGAEMLALARRIQASVAERFGVALEPEPRIIA